MTREQIYQNESSGARSKELSHDSDRIDMDRISKNKNYYGLKGMASNNSEA